MYEVKSKILDVKVIDNKLTLANFEELKSIVEENRQVINSSNVDSENYLVAKKLRASLNNTEKQLSKAESDFKKDFMNDYLTKSNYLKSNIQEISKNLDYKIKAYEQSIGIEKTYTKYLTFKSYDLELLNKIKELIEKEFDIKGEIK